MMQNNQPTFISILGVLFALFLAGIIGIGILWHFYAELVVLFLMAALFALGMTLVVASLTVTRTTIKWANEQYYPLKKELTPDVKLLLNPNQLTGGTPISYIEGDFTVSDND